MTTQLTAEERAEARRLRKELGRWIPPGGKILVNKLNAAIDALEAVERERDEAVARLHRHCLDESCCDGSDIIPDLRASLSKVERERDGFRQSADAWAFKCGQHLADRDMARDQVAMLAEALRFYASADYDRPCYRPSETEIDSGDRARAALTLAGLGE